MAAMPPSDPAGSPPAPPGAPLPENANPVNAGRGEAYDREPMPLSNEATELMTAARDGRPAAFEALFQRVRGSAFQAARSLVGSYEDAQDLTQEAFIKAYRARASYDPSQPFLPWFHRILRNTCFSHLRKRGRMRERSIHATAPGAEDESAWEILDEDAPAPSAKAELSEREATFAAAMERLSARDAEIIALRHYQELSYKEIASALSIPEGTVMSRLFHARKRLKGMLATQMDDLLGAGGGAAAR